MGFLCEKDGASPLIGKISRFRLLLNEKSEWEVEAVVSSGPDA
jgi:hypothetical protein